MRVFFSILTASSLMLGSLPTWGDQPTSPSVKSSAPPSAAPDDVQKAMVMPIGPARNAALTAAVTGWAQTHPQDAMNYGGTIKDHPLQRIVLTTAGKIWIETDEKSALDWGLHHGSGIQQHFIFGSYGSKEKQAAAEWLLKQPEHNAGEFGVLIEAWCGHEMDNQKSTAEATAWLLQQKQLSKADAAAGIYFVVAATAWKDPVATAAWVAQLPPNFSMLAGAKSVIGIWSRKIPADIPKIRDWIQTLPISDAEKTEAAKAIVVK